MDGMNTRQAAQYIEEQHGQSLSPLTLANLRCIGGGPVFRRVGRAVVYSRTDLDTYAASRISPPMKSTRDPARAANSSAAVAA